MKKKILYVLVFTMALSVLAACGNKKSDASAGETGTETTQATAAPMPAEAASKLTEEEAKEIAQEQKKVAEQAKKEEEQAQKEVAKKVITSSVAESVPIPDGFPVQNVPVIQGAQIVSASKNGNTYNMVLRVNIPAADAYQYYFDLYDTIGSAEINANVKNASLSVERAKSGLKADFAFANEDEKSSTVTMKVIQEN